MIWERDGGKEREGEHRCVVLLIYALIGWFLYVPWPGIKPAALVGWDDALTNWATWPGLLIFKNRQLIEKISFDDYAIFVRR